MSDGKVIEDKKIRDTKYTQYKETPTVGKSKDVLLGFIIACKKFKTNFFNQILTLLSVLLCAVLLFGGNIIADYCVGDYSRGAYEKENKIIEVKKNDNISITEKELKQIQNLNGVELTILPELYQYKTKILGIHDSWNDYQYVIDNSLSFGDTKIQSIEESTFIDESQVCYITFTGNRSLYFKLKCLEIEHADRYITDNNCIYLSYSTLDFIQKCYSIEKKFQIKDTNHYLNITNTYISLEDDKTKLLEEFLEIDLTDSFEGLFVPEQYISSELKEEIHDETLIIWDNRFETSLYLTEEERARVSYTFYEDLEFETEHLYVICNESQILKIDNTLNKLDYHTFKLQDLKFPLEDHDLFFSNTFFFSLNVVLAILIYILLKVTYKKLLKARQKEFVLLKKIGFSNKAIFIHMICPILLSLILALAISGCIYLVRPFIIWYFYVIPICLMVVVTYHLCKHIY
ncbi:MAG: hypothetical protein K2K50_01985, partial [Anaeroplasmataceae bacterium]|nr:hypothetical protein [Anaeroplasmataceae bacterium]